MLIGMCGRRRIGQNKVIVLAHSAHEQAGAQPQLPPSTAVRDYDFALKAQSLRDCQHEPDHLCFQLSPTVYSAHPACADPHHAHALLVWQSAQTLGCPYIGRGCASLSESFSSGGYCCTRS